MRVRAETLLIAAMSLFAVVGLAAVHFLDEAPTADVDDVLIDPTPDPELIGPSPVDPSPSVGPQSASAWFQENRRYCNPVDVETRLRWQPAPGNGEGTMYEAACYALAGKIDRARGAIEQLPPARRPEAAGVVFGAGHAAADAGDELAAGPLMELVLEYWPNHYMALYHAGAARFERGDREAARGYLRRFLQEYAADDGWRASALSMLEALEG